MCFTYMYLCMYVLYVRGGREAPNVIMYVHKYIYIVVCIVQVCMYIQVYTYNAFIKAPQKAP